MSRNKVDRTGETNISSEGCGMKIIKYNSNRDIIIEFQDEHKYRVHTSYPNFKKGKCKNPFFPSVYEHGYLGVNKNGNVPKTRELKDGKWVQHKNIISGKVCYADALTINIKKDSQPIKVLFAVKNGYVLLTFWKTLEY